MIGIIVGAGRIGYNLAKSMAEDHDITIIEKDKIACEKKLLTLKKVQQDLLQELLSDHQYKPWLL